MKLENNYRKENEKRTHTGRLNNTAHKRSKWSMKKSKRKSENTLRQMKMHTQHAKTYGMQQKQFQEVILKY